MTKNYSCFTVKLMVKILNHRFSHIAIPFIFSSLVLLLKNFGNDEKRKIQSLGNRKKMAKVLG